MRKIKHFIQQSWLLIVASFLFGLLIALTNAAWSPRIIQNEKNKLYNLMTELIRDANDFKVVIESVDIAGKKGRVTKTAIYEAIDANDNGAGFAFVAVGPGFADKIKLVIAVDSKCEQLFGFKVLASNETPGFGDKIKEDYLGDQFRQAPAEQVHLIKTGDSQKIDSEIVAITGATVSSEAVIKIFNAHIETVKEQLLKEGLIR